MKTIFAMMALVAFAASPAFAMCGHETVAMSQSEVEVAEAQKASDVDMTPTASIPKTDKAEASAPAPDAEY